MALHWDPTYVLQLWTDGRCVGHAPSKGRKCRMPIPYDNVKRLLVELAEQQPDADLLEPKLKCLAHYGLCIRFHQYQIDDMVRKWSAMLRAAYPPRPLVQSSRHSATSRTSTRTSSTIVSSRSSSPVISTSISLNDRIVAPRLQDTSRAAQRRLDSLRYISPPASPSPSISRVSTSDISTIRLSRSSTTQSTIAPRVQPSTLPAPRHRAPSPPTTPEVPSTPVVTQSSAVDTTPTIPSPPTTPTTQSPATTRRCASKHVRRLPLDEECPICYDDVPLSECNASELVWCRSGCGRTVHKSCFDVWRAERGSTQPLVCMVCRASWAEECDCCTISHVCRREVSGNCSVCQEDLKEDDGEHALSWCKAGCGRSVHQDCFESWRKECVGSGRAATCTDCRTVWVDECEC
jgi:hypothetical protein